MRHRVARAGQELSFRGIDVAIPQGATVRAILGYLDRVDPAAAREWKPKNDRVAVEQGVTNAKELAALLETKCVEYMSRSTETDFANCRTADALVFVDAPTPTILEWR